MMSDAPFDVADGETSDAARFVDFTEAERSDVAPTVAASTPAGLCVGVTVKKKFEGFGAQLWSGEVTAVYDAAGTFDTLWEDGEELVFDFGEARAMLDAADAETSSVDGLEIVAREAPLSDSASRDDAAPKPGAAGTSNPGGGSLPEAHLPGRRGGARFGPPALFFGPRRTVESARAAMVHLVDSLYGASHGGARCPPDLYAGWSVVLTRQTREPLRWVDGGGRVWRSQNLAARAMGLVPELGPPKHKAKEQHWAETPFGNRRGLLREGSAAAAAGGSDLPAAPPPGDLSPPAPGSNVLRVLDLDDVAGARDLSVQFLDLVYGATHGGAPCPPAKYAGWSVVLTGFASEPTKFVDGAGSVYRTRNDVARKIGVLAGAVSNSRKESSSYAKIPYGDRRALLFEPGGLGLPASPAAPAAAAAPTLAAAAPSPAAAAPASPPPAALPEGDDGLEGGVDIIDGLEIVAEEAPSHARQSFALADARASTVAELEETIAARDETIARLKRQLRDYEQPAAPARPAVSRPAAQGRFLPAKPGKQPRDDAARRPPPPPSLPKARLGERGGRTASAHTPLFLRPRRTVEGARAAMIMVVDDLYGASHSGARCPPDVYAGWSVVLTRMGTEPLRWVDGGGRVWRSRNDATRAMGLVPELGPPERRAADQHWAKMPFGIRRGLLRAGTPGPEVVDLASDDERRRAARKKPRRE